MPSLTDDLKEVLATELSDQSQVEFCVLFGSQLTDKARADSDVDIGYYSKSPLSLAEELALQAKLVVRVGRDVDLVGLAEATPLLVFEATKSARLLFGEREAWLRFKAQAALAHAEFAIVSEPASRLYLQRLSEGRGLR